MREHAAPDRLRAVALIAEWARRRPSLAGLMHVLLAEDLKEVLVAERD